MAEEKGGDAAWGIRERIEDGAPLSARRGEDGGRGHCSAAGVGAACASGVFCGRGEVSEEK